MGNREKSPEVQDRDQGKKELAVGQLGDKVGEGSLRKESSLLTAHQLWAKHLLLKEFLIQGFIQRPLIPMKTVAQLVLRNLTPLLFTGTNQVSKSVQVSCSPE